MENVRRHESSNSTTILRSADNSSLITKIVSFFCALLLIVTYQPMAVFAGETINSQSENTKIEATENNQTNNTTVIQINQDTDTVGKVIAGTVAGGVAGGAGIIITDPIGPKPKDDSYDLAIMGGLVGVGITVASSVLAPASAAFALPVLAAAGAGFAIYEGVKSFAPKKDKSQASQIVIINNGNSESRSSDSPKLP